MSALPALHNTLGADFIGTILAAALWGVSTVQTYWYFTHYTKDVVLLKSLVAGVWVLDTLHQIFISHAVYMYTVTHYADPPHLYAVEWSLVAQVLVNAFVALLVQGFLTVRIFRLSQRNLILTGIAVALVLANFGLSLIFFGKTVHFNSILEAQAQDIKNLSMSVNALGAAGDVFIAFVLCYLLYTRKTGFQRSDNIITRMIIFTVNTGLLTSLCAILSFILIITLPNTFLYQVFYFLLGRLYCNSLLATLNVRKSYTIDGTSEPQMTSLHPKENGNRLKMTPMNRAQHGGLAIQIQTVQETDRDFLHFDDDVEAKITASNDDADFRGGLPYDGSRSTKSSGL